MIWSCSSQLQSVCTKAIIEDGTLPLPESDLLRLIRDTKLRLMIVKTILIDDIYIHTFIYRYMNIYIYIT